MEEKYKRTPNGANSGSNAQVPDTPVTKLAFDGGAAITAPGSSKVAPSDAGTTADGAAPKSGDVEKGNSVAEKALQVGLRCSRVDARLQDAA